MYSFYYPNVTTLRSGLCYRTSLCLSSVTFVRLTQGVEIFGNISSPLCTLAIFRLPRKTLRRSSQGNRSVKGV